MYKSHLVERSKYVCTMRMVRAMSHTKETRMEYENGTRISILETFYVYHTYLRLSVKTGEILAMCSYPTFNPNNITTADTVGMKNAVISDIYEPGSTFKLVTAAASIEENIEDRNSIIATESLNEIKGLKISDVHSASSMTFQQAIEQSSNIGFSKISLKLGAERFYKYARDFGFGSLS